MKPLIVDKRDKVKGLFVYCQKCQRIIDNRICGTTKKRLSTCKSTEQHMFKAIVTVPGTNSKKRKTKVFRTRNIQEAAKLKYQFDQELKELGYQSPNKLNENEIEQKPKLLIECMAMYIGYLNNDGVESHKIKVRSKSHIKDIERFFRYLCISLRENGIDHTLVTIDQLNDKAVGMLHNYLIYNLKYKSKSYNKLIGAIRQFINWLIVEKDYKVKNYFNGVARRAEVIDKTIVTKDEFDSLLSVINFDNGWKEFSTGERKNLYRDWLVFAFRLALETGLRREEFMSIRFQDIVHDESGVSKFIKIENFKVNRINGVSGSENAAMKHIPITLGLHELIDDLKNHQTTELTDYIIANNENTTLKTRIDVVSKAFTHFWKFIESDKNAQLKHLRKTYLTALVKQFGEKANIISSHSGIEVMKKHYVNDLELTKASESFSVFGESKTARKVKS